MPVLQRAGPIGGGVKQWEECWLERRCRLMSRVMGGRLTAPDEHPETGCYVGLSEYSRLQARRANRHRPRTRRGHRSRAPARRLSN